MAFVDFLRELLYQGRIVVTPPLRDAGADESQGAAFLERVFSEQCLTLAGPRLEFDRGAALAAARFVAAASWHLLNHEDDDATVTRQLQLADPRSPAQHFSGDLVLRYVPQLYRRAHGLNPSDVLTERLANVLLRWPLSGVLADGLEGTPATLEFGAHAGLLLLYAERLAEHFRPAWLPRGAGWQYVELVWRELGKDVALLGKPS